jgi:hypothetical protein
MLTVLQGGCTKFYCFYREWDSRARDCHCRTENGHTVQKQHQVKRMWHILLQGIGQKPIRLHCISSRV